MCWQVPLHAGVGLGRIIKGSFRLCIPKEGVVSVDSDSKILRLTRRYSASVHAKVYLVELCANVGKRSGVSSEMFRRAGLVVSSAKRSNSESQMNPHRKSHSGSVAWSWDLEGRRRYRICGVCIMDCDSVTEARGCSQIKQTSQTQPPAQSPRLLSHALFSQDCDNDGNRCEKDTTPGSSMAHICIIAQNAVLASSINTTTTLCMLRFIRNYSLLVPPTPLYNTCSVH